MFLVLLDKKVDQTLTVVDTSRLLLASKLKKILDLIVTKFSSYLIKFLVS